MSKIIVPSDVSILVLHTSNIAKGNILWLMIIAKNVWVHTVLRMMIMTYHKQMISNKTKNDGDVDGDDVEVRRRRLRSWKQLQQLQGT